MVRVLQGARVIRGHHISDQRNLLCVLYALCRREIGGEVAYAEMPLAARAVESTRVVCGGATVPKYPYVPFVFSRSGVSISSGPVTCTIGLRKAWRRECEHNSSDKQYFFSSIAPDLHVGATRSTRFCFGNSVSPAFCGTFDFEK
jgi:hypothetical protein